MFTNNNYSGPEWDVVKNKAKQVLREVARHECTISYSELAEKIGGHAIGINARSDQMNNLLAQISTEENSAGRGMLSVVVVHKVGDKQPGKGFYELAKRLGKDASDELVFWVKESKHVYGYWKNN